MRYSRMEGKQPPKSSGGKGIIAIVIVAILAAAVYLIGASKVGEFLSDNVVEPIVGVFADGDNGDADAAGDENDEPSQTKNANTVDFTLPEFSIYALQAGVFSDMQNAQKYADELINKGGAGYIVEFADGYRVLISGYLSEDDAKNVKSRLLEEQNMDTSVIEIKGEEIKAEIEADLQTAELISSASINEDIQRLTEISISRDKAEITEEQAVEELTAMKETATAMIEKLSDVDDDDLANALKNYYVALEEALERAISDLDEVAFSSGVKYAYLAAAVAREQLSSELAA